MQKRLFHCERAAFLYRSSYKQIDGSTAPQTLCVEIDMVLHEGRDKVVAVVVAFVAAQYQGLACMCTGRLEGFRVQLLGQKPIGQTLVYQYASRKRILRFFHEQRCVMVSPGLAV